MSRVGQSFEPLSAADIQKFRPNLTRAEFLRLAERFLNFQIEHYSTGSQELVHISGGGYGGGTVYAVPVVGLYEPCVLKNACVAALSRDGVWQVQAGTFARLVRVTEEDPSGTPVTEWTKVATDLPVTLLRLTSTDVPTDALLMFEFSVPAGDPLRVAGFVDLVRTAVPQE